MHFLLRGRSFSIVFKKSPKQTFYTMAEASSSEIAHLVQSSPCRSSCDDTDAPSPPNLEQSATQSLNNGSFGLGDRHEDVYEVYQFRSQHAQLSAVVSTILWKIMSVERMAATRTTLPCILRLQIPMQVARLLLETRSRRFSNASPRQNSSMSCKVIKSKTPVQLASLSRCQTSAPTTSRTHRRTDWHNQGSMRGRGISGLRRRDGP